MNIFDYAFAYLLDDEGRKYTNDPDDSGGPTKYGITKKTYETFFNRTVLDIEIQTMTEAVAKQIYLALFWNPMSCNRMTNPAIATAILDTGVLYGVGTSALIAQQALSLCGATLKFDGVIGDKTVGFLNTVTTGSFMPAFEKLVLKRIEVIIAAHPKDEKYRSGWVKRAKRLLTLVGDQSLKST